MIRARSSRFLDERTGDGAASSARRCATSSPTTGRSCSARSRSTRFIVLVAHRHLPDALLRAELARRCIYHGSYAPLHGREMSEAYRSAVDLSLRRQGGAADPPDAPLGGGRLRRGDRAAPAARSSSPARSASRASSPTASALTMLIARAPRGLPRLLDRRRPAVGDGPRDRLLGRDVDPVRRRRTSRTLLWGGAVPGRRRLRVAHVHRARPAPARSLIGDADRGCTCCSSPRGTTRSSAGRAATERNVVGVPTCARPGAALARPAVRASPRVLVPARRPRPDQPDLAVGPVPRRREATNGAQPDWYLGWLIGALRLVPGFDVTIGDYTLVPNPFWGGVALPAASSSSSCSPGRALERRVTGDHGFHNLLDRPRDAPVAHRDRRRLLHLDLHRVRGRCGRSPARSLQPLLPGPDLDLPGARLGPAGRGALRDEADLRRARRAASTSSGDGRSPKPSRSSRPGAPARSARRAPRPRRGRLPANASATRRSRAR